MSGDAIEVEGRVIEHHRGDIFVCEVSFGGRTVRVTAKRSGRLVKHRLMVLPGDVVMVEISCYDTSRGRIVFRGTREERERRRTGT